MADHEQLELLKRGVREWNHWRRENLAYVDLSKADLPGTDLRETNFRHADLNLANLSGAMLVLAGLRGAHLRGADLSDSDLRGADLREADLRDADLRKADLRSADLRDTNLTGAVLSGARIDSVSLGFSNLSTHFDGVSGIEAIDHWGPSAISPEALEKAQGKLPDDFLKGIGFKDWEILNAKLHDPNLRPDEVIDITYQVADLRTKGPIQVNTLFISYARVDSDFVEFLEKKLDEDGIRSWRDVHDMVAGPVQPQIERAIDLNGTVLLVLSSNSLGSDWVEWEVQKARDLQKKLEGEGKRDAHVLCPVAIDDAWKDSKWSGPLMNQLLKYNILDFSKWEDEEAVDKVYGKLKAGIAKYYSDFGDSDDQD